MPIGLGIGLALPFGGTVPFEPAATLALDFTSARYRNGAGGYYTSDFSTLSGLTVTRASVGYAETVAGALVQFAQNVARITDKGFLSEEARTNLFLNSFAPVTQNVTITAASHTITVWGTGSVTVAAGTATISNGGAVTAGSPRTIGCTVAGTISVTVSGSPSIVQVEAGTFGTSPIPTTSASATRAADVVSLGSVTTSYPLTVLAEFQIAAIASNVTMIGGVSGLPNIGLNANPRITSAIRGVVDLASPVDLYTLGLIGKAAAKMQSGASTAVLNGGTVATDADAFSPTLTGAIGLGHDALTGASQINGYLRRAVIYSRAFSDAELQAATL